MVDVDTVLTEGNPEEEIGMNPAMIAAMKFAPMTSADVERSFSTYKHVLTEKRTSFTPEHLKKYMICNLNSETKLSE